MSTSDQTRNEIACGDELEDLRLRLQETQELLEAIRSGGIDALVVSTDTGNDHIFTLEGADRLYRVFLESMSQGALTLNVDGLILYANQAAAALLTSAKTELVAADLREFVGDHGRVELEELLSAAQSTPVSAELTLCRDKAGMPVHVALQPFEDRGDKMLAAILTDLSERRKTEELLEAERFGAFDPRADRGGRRRL